MLYNKIITFKILIHFYSTLFDLNKYIDLFGNNQKSTANITI